MNVLLGIEKFLRSNTVVMSYNLYVGIKSQGTLSGHLSLALPDVFLMEKELPIEITNVNRVKIDLERRKIEKCDEKCRLPEPKSTNLRFLSA